LAFNLESRRYEWGFHLHHHSCSWAGYTFDPTSVTGPAPVNDFHINMVHVDDTGIYLSGLRTEAMLFLSSQWIASEVCSLPAGTHNARPWRDGVLFNDTASDCVRFVPRQGQPTAFGIVRYDDSAIQFAGIDDSKVARQAFGRGLCTVGDRFIAAGSSPSTITLYDMHSRQKVGSVNLSMDIRNAIHGLEVWPFEN
jgi:hypothetical protein